MKKFLFLICFLSTTYIMNAQTGLKFKNVFNISITGNKLGTNEIIAKEELVVEKGTVVKITTSELSYTSSFGKIPSPVVLSDQGMIYINDFPVTQIPEANIATVNFPIWLRAGIYQVKLVAKSNTDNKKLNGLVNGIIYEIED